VQAEAHVLVVDDEAELRDVLREYLSRHRMEVSAADGGPAMREIMASRPVDLVILDVRMPGEDGLSLARELRAKGGVGIVMLTAEGETVDRIIGLEVGADDYLPKPFDPRELLARVRSVLRRTKPAALPSSAAAPPVRRRRRAGRSASAAACSTWMPAGCARPTAARTCRSPRWSSTCSRSSRPTRTGCSAATGCSTSRTAGTRSRSSAASTSGSRACAGKVERDPAKPAVIKTVRGGGYLFDPGGTGGRG
jgi:DNA-binding response OmpR family regulator